MPLITLDRLRRFAPSANPEILQAIVEGWDRRLLDTADINTPLRVEHFLTQIATETGGLKAISENLNYSVEGLLRTFSRSRISSADCWRFGRSPSHPANQNAIANIIYGGKFGRQQLGNTEPGDGWRYRGSGLMQTTGRANFRRAGHENDPEALRQPQTALISAITYWTSRDLNRLADLDDLVAVRKGVNGGTNGMKHAEAFLIEAKRIFA